MSNSPGTKPGNRGQSRKQSVMHAFGLDKLQAAILHPHRKKSTVDRQASQASLILPDNVNEEASSEVGQPTARGTGKGCGSCITCINGRECIKEVAFEGCGRCLCCFNNRRCLLLDPLPGQLDGGKSYSKYMRPGDTLDDVVIFERGTTTDQARSATEREQIDEWMKALEDIMSQNIGAPRRRERSMPVKKEKEESKVAKRLPQGFKNLKVKVTMGADKGDGPGTGGGMSRTPTNFGAPPSILRSATDKASSVLNSGLGSKTGSRENSTRVSPRSSQCASPRGKGPGSNPSTNPTSPIGRLRSGRGTASSQSPKN